MTLEPPYDPAPALELIERIETELQQLRGLVQPHPPGLDPKDSRNKYPDGKLTVRGVEICYRYFDQGKTRHAVAKAMDISHGAATYRQGRWRKAGGARRKRLDLA